MHLIFMDESGDISFSEQSGTKFFTVTCLTIDESVKQKMKNTMIKKKAKLYNLGWSRNIEIKAYTLHRLKYNRKLRQEVGLTIDGDKFIKEILTTVVNSYHPQINCVAINKDKIESESLKRAEYGIAYNYFAGRLLSPLVLKLENCELTVDLRSKETHNKKHFNDYIKTGIIGEAFNRGIEISLAIHHLESHKNLGLQTVDFFSWAIYRHIAYNDSRFFDIFRDLVDDFQCWYC